MACQVHFIVQMPGVEQTPFCDSKSISQSRALIVECHRTHTPTRPSCFDQVPVDPSPESP